MQNQSNLANHSPLFTLTKLALTRLGKYSNPACLFRSIGIACLLFFGSCHGSVPEPANPDPVFEVNYQIAGQNHTRTAGVNGLYLFADAEYQDEVWQFSGSFTDATCPVADCPETLRFLFQNYTLGAVFDSTWNTGTFPFYGPGNFDSTVYRTTLGYSSDYPQTPEVFWILDDIFTFDGAQITYDATKPQVDVYQTAQFSSGLTVASTQLFFTAENQFCLQAAMQAERDSSGLITLTALPAPPGNYLYTWNTNDTSASIQTDWQPDATYTVTVSRANGGCTAVVSMGNLPEAFSTIHSGLVTGDAVPIFSSQRIGPIVEWIDAQGLRWRSDWGDQSFPADFFELLEVSDYERNENGLPTKRMRVRWNCRLYNDGGESVPMTGQGIIGVGWPG